MKFLRTASFVVLGWFSASPHAADAPKPDPTQAYLTMLTAAAARGDSASQVCLGNLYASGFDSIASDRDKAFGLYKKAADHGDLEGERALGGSYMYGVGVKQDVAKAGSIFHALADKGYAPADLDLSLMYANGNGVTENAADALKWLEKGAEGGDPESQIRLAIHYHFGEDVKQDDAKAQEWLDKAVAHDIDCLPTYARLIPYIADVYLINSLTEAEKKAGSGRLGIRFIYSDQRATHIELMESSGSSVVDQNWMTALSKAKLPRWPKSYVTDDYMMGFWL